MYETGWKSSEKLEQTFQSVLNIWALGAIKKVKVITSRECLAGWQSFVSHPILGCMGEIVLRCSCHIAAVSERPRLQIEYFSCAFDTACGRRSQLCARDAKYLL